jgi:hypothetical protein
MDARELVKLCHNPVYFASKIIDEPLSEKQYYWLMSQEKGIRFGQTRHSFRTSTMLIRLLHTVWFTSNTKVFYVTHNFATAVAVSQCFREMMDLFDYPVRPGQHNLNLNEIRFDNDSAIGFYKAVGHMGRGMSLNTIAIDNCSLIKPIVLDEMYTYILPETTLLIAE